MIVKIIDAGTAPSKGAILEEINEQHQRQSIKKYHLKIPNETFLVQIRCRFYAYLSWDLSSFLLIFGSESFAMDTDQPMLNPKSKASK